MKPENGGYCPKSKQKKRLKTSNQKSKPEIASTSFDIWSDDSKGDGALSPDWFQPTIKSELKPRKQIKPSTRDAIEIVESGASYNPSSTDHHNLLKKAADIRLEGLKKEKKYRQYSRGISSLGPQQVDLPVNIPSEDDNSETNDTEVEQTSNYVQHVERKTKTERNREKRRKIHESTVQKNFEAKLRRRELETLDQSLESIVKQETLRQVEKKEPDYDKGQEIKKLGKIKYKEDEPEFLLPDELPGSMRRLPGKYSVLKDRFESLQKRNIIETRVPSKYVLNYNCSLNLTLFNRQILKYPKKVFDKSK